jgi:hypothetical protein
MATIPNYYFQSPSIEAAGRNLATALAPRDPKEQLAIQMAKWQFEHEKTKAANEADDRAEKQAAEEDFASILTLPKILKPDGTVDQDATEAAVMEKYASGVRHGGDPKKGGDIAGPFAPQFQTKQIELGLRNEFTAQQLAARLGAYADVARQHETGLDRRQAADQGFKADLSDQNYRQQLEIDTNRAQLRMEENRQKIKDGGGTPPPIVAGTVLQDIVHKLRFRQQQTGRPMEQRYMDKLVDEASQDFQSSRSVVTSINRIWAKHGLDSSAPEKQHKGFVDRNIFQEPDYNYLVPSGYDEAPAAPDAAPAATPPADGSLGGAAVNAGAASQPEPDLPKPSPAAAAPRFAPPKAAPKAAPKPAAKAAPTRTAGPPKEGDIITTKSGRKAKLVNGKWKYQ